MYSYRREVNLWLGNLLKYQIKQVEISEEVIIKWVGGPF